MRMPERPEVVRAKKSGRWIVWGCPWTDCQWCGPYKTRAEAEEGVQAVKRAIRFQAHTPKRKRVAL